MSLTRNPGRALPLLLFLALGVAALGVRGSAQEPGKADAERVVWIYRDVPPEGAEDTRSEPERLFQPYFIFPAAVVDRVALTDRYAANRLERDGMGTCCQFSFKLGGAGWFAGVKFIPGGRDPGENEGIDVNRALRLGEVLDTQVALRFRARSAATTSPKVVFQLGNTSGRRHADGHRFAKVLRPSPTRLSDTWTEYTIDLTGDPKALRSVICPLCILVKSDDNPGADVVDVYVDDVRFEVLPPAKKGR